MIKMLGINALIEKRDNLVFERDQMLTEYNNQIAEFESCIELLSGKPYSETVADFKFDDESPNYVKGSQEEI
jgi:hypothetical protein